jgi:hypothetical protein
MASDFEATRAFAVVADSDYGKRTITSSATEHTSAMKQSIFNSFVRTARTNRKPRKNPAIVPEHFKKSY